MADAAKPDPKAPAKYEPPKELEQKAAVQKFQGRPKRQPVEQAEYFYNVRKTHILMFFSSVAMLVSFVLMFWKDFDRPWKPYQEQFAAMEFEKLWYDMNELQAGVTAKKAELDRIDDQIKTFLGKFRTADGKGLRLKVDLFGDDPLPVPGLEAPPWNGEVHVRVDETKKEEWQKKLAIVEREKIRGDLYNLVQLFNFAKDEQGAIRYKYEEAKHHYEAALKKADPRLGAFEHHFRDAEKEWDAVRKRVEERKVGKDEVEKRDAFYDDFRAALERRKVPGVWDGKPLEELKKERDRIAKELADKHVRFEKERPSLPNTIRDAPGLDIYSRRLQVKQVILGDVKDQLNFIKIDKVDRCHTCHAGIDNPTYAVDTYPDAKDEGDRVRFREPFLRLFVAHARGKVEAKECKICDPVARAKPGGIKAPLTPHGAWSVDDAIKFTKSLMAHPRLDLFVKDSSRHPIASFGCTVCHEGDGRDTDFTRVVHTPDTYEQGQRWKNRHGTPYGEERYNWNYRELWDLPMFPSKFAQSSCRRCHVDAVELDGAEKYVQGMKLFERAGCYGCHRTETYQILRKDVENPLKDVNHKVRRPGPPLERIAAKVESDWMKKWVLEPRDFRPTTRMPHFFQLSNTRHEVNKKPYPPEKGRSPVDDTIVTCITEYIWSLSKTDKEPDPPALKGDRRRGELLVQQVGCIACHRSEDVAVEEYRKRGESRFLKEFAPTLAGIGSKVNRAWLYAWVRDPKKHFADSSMPNLRLSEQEAVDVVEYLMALKKPEWEAKPAPKANLEVVKDLVREQLKKQISDKDAELAVEGKHPVKAFSELKTPEGQRLWLGRKMVKNYGCYSCHLLKKDEASLPLAMDWQNEEGIGVELTGAQPFGSKHHDRLDFGLAAEDGVNHHGMKFKHGFSGGDVEAHVLETRHDWLKAKLNNPRVFDGGKMTSKPWDELLRMPWFDFSAQEIEWLQTFVLSFTDHDPAGLVGGLKHRMTPDQIAKNRGERVVRDNNCRACHRLSLDQFEVRWEREEGEGEKRKKKESWEWIEGRNLGQLPPEAAEKAIKDAGLLAKSEKFDEKSMGAWIVDWASDRRTLELNKVINPDAKTVAKVGPRWWYLDKEPREIRHQIDMDGGEILPHLESFKKALNKAYVAEKEKLDNRNDDLDDLIKAAANNPAKQQELKNEQAAIRVRLAAEFPTDDLVKSDQMEGRYPPLLRTQGVKTQADWLFGFLKKPYPIRPNIFPAAPGAKALADVNIRMPSFDLTDEETNAVVRWFAMRDHLAGKDFFPNTAIPEREESLLEKRKDVHQSVLTRILLNTDQGCAKCHYINGRPPTGDLYAYAPDLANVGQRLRPRWLYSWQNDPAAIYPRTTMTNFWSDLKNPNRTDEIHGAVELLMNPKKLSVPNK